MDISSIKEKLSEVKLPSFGGKPKGGGAAKTTPVGLDIGTSRIRMVVLQSGTATPLVEKLIDVKMPSTLVSGSRVVDTEGLADEITRMLDEAGVRTPEISLHVGGGDVQLKRFTMERRAPDEARRMLPTHPQFKNYAGDVEAMQFSLHILDPDREGSTMEVVAVAAKKDAVRTRQRAVIDAGAFVHAVDVDALALFNVFSYIHRGEASKKVTLVHLGRQSALIVVVGKGAPGLIRHAHTGVGALIDTIAESSVSIQREAAEDALFSSNPMVIYPGPFKEWCDTFAEEIRRTAQAFDRGAENPLGKIYLSGGGSMITGLPGQLESRLKVSVQQFDPLEAVGFADGVRTLGGGEGARYAIAMGLALRQVASQ